ncbi:MAG: hypothetical protein GEEBNDBF_02273 [bacterium]|nr:hypothetical protein [bacterium]
MARMCLWGLTAVVAFTLAAGCSGSDRTTAPPSAGQGTGANLTTGNSQEVPDLVARHEAFTWDRTPHFIGQGVPWIASTQMPELGVPELTGAVAMSEEGRTQGSLGVFTLKIDEDLNAYVETPRESQAQGDHYLLGVRQFFQSRHIRVRQIVRNGSLLDVTLRFTHPIPLPANLTPPPTAQKRLDLHIFNLWAGIVVPNTQTFFAGANPVTTNTTVLRNPDTYRPIGGLATLPPGSGSVLPGRWIVDSFGGQNFTAGTYNGTNNGWSTTPDQLAPRGFGVVPQGSSVDVTYSLDPGAIAGGLSLNFVMLADYCDPRGGVTSGEKFANRLPNPLDPTGLRYVLPFGAGDLQDVEIPNVSSLGLDGSVTRTVSVRVTDFDADFPATGTFPNPSNLSLLPRASGIQSVSASFPSLVSSVINATEATGSGSGFPAAPKIYEFPLSNQLEAAAGTYWGLVRVVDQESGLTSGAPYYQVDPNLVPLTQQVPIEVYQSRLVTVAGTGPTGPKTIVLEGDADDPSFVFSDGAGGFAPWVDDPVAQQVGGLSVDDIIGAPIVTIQGLGIFADPTVYGRAVLSVFFEDPSASPPGGFNIPGYGFGNGAGTLSAPRSQRLLNYISSRAFAGSLSPNPNARGVWGFADLVTDGISTNNALWGRGIFVQYDDYDLYYNDRATWLSGAFDVDRLLVSEVHNVAPEVNPDHAGGVDQTLMVAMATSDYDRGPATPREMYANDLVVVQGLRGPYNPAQEATPTITQVYDTLDYDDPATTDPEAWGIYRWAGPTANSQNRPDMAGAGAGKINPKTTRGADFAIDADRLFIADDADDSVEVYQALPDGLPQLQTDSMNMEWQYLGATSQAGAINNPLDLTVVGDGNGASIVIVLDLGGADDFYRLVAMDPMTLAVIGTRDLVTDITTGAISIGADRSLANGLDETAFALLWDDPAGVNANVGPVGGIFWYTVQDS